jgi:predicted DNA-binding transcriptional regulator AlpA
MTIKFLTWDDLKAMGIVGSRQHNRRLRDKGEFPKPIRLGDPVRGRLAWLESEILTHVAKRAAERDLPRPRREPKVVPLAASKQRNLKKAELPALASEPHTASPPAPDTSKRSRKPGRQAERFTPEPGDADPS